MRYTLAGFPSGAAVWLVLGFVLASQGHPGLAATGDDMPVVAQVQGQDALATAEVRQELASPGGSPVPPAVTVERQGRLLVLKYGSPGAMGQRLASASRGGEPPTFTVYKGQRKIASGQFEYG